MNRIHEYLIGCLLPLSLFAVDATWTGNTSDDLETATNWQGDVLPTGTAIFNSNLPPANFTPKVLSSDTAPFVLTNFDFPGSASAFTFTVEAPYGLQFIGTDCGITGVNTNTTINATTNTQTTVNFSQFIFSGSNPSIGDATLSALITPSTTVFTNLGSVTDLGQVVFDGSGDSASKTLTLFLDSTLGSIGAVNKGVISSAFSTAMNDLGQIIFDGSGGQSAGAAGTGENRITIGGSTYVTATNQYGSGSLGTIQSNNTLNDMGQIIFDGSGGLSYAHVGKGSSVVTVENTAKLYAVEDQGYLYPADGSIGNDIGQIVFDGSGGVSYGAGGIGSSTVVIKDSAYISATAPNYGYIGYSGSPDSIINNMGQILFDGSGGTGYGAAGRGSSTVIITDSAELYASGTYYLENLSDSKNNTAQILFDGSGGTGYGAGGSGSMSVTVNGQAQVKAETLVENYIYTDTNYANNIAQILFDGTPGLNYAGGGSGSCIVSIADSAQIIGNNFISIGSSVYINDSGQIVFDGSGGFGYGEALSNKISVTVSDQAILNAMNSGSVYNGYGNNCGQIIFDGGGGFTYDHSQNGHAEITLQGGAQILASNVGNGSIYLTNYGSNNLAQILFDGSGGFNGSSSTGDCTTSIQDTVTLFASNSAFIGISVAGIISNNIGQIVFDGSGGTNALGTGQGMQTLAISTTTPVTAVNQATGTISVIAGNTTNKVGQIVFDGSNGSGTTGVGDLTITLGDDVSFTATNGGTISSAGTSKGVGQIIFDGRAGSASGSTGLCTLVLNGTNIITATNKSTGAVSGDQIAFYDTTVEGAGIVQAINSGTIDHGVAFYGASATAVDVQVQLTGSSLHVDSTVSPTFAIASLSGDSASTAVLGQNLTLNSPSKGLSATFAGDISGSGDLIMSGSGQQKLAGVNSYTGTTTVRSGTLTLLQSNIPGTLTVATGGTFTGVGTVSGAATVDGNIRAGQSPGTLTFTSGLTLSPTANTIVELSPNLGSLYAVSGGNATVAGKLTVVQDPGVKAGNAYTIISDTGGSVSGTFSSLAIEGPYIPVVLYSSSDVVLTLMNAPSTFAAQLIAPDRILRNMETLKELDTRRESAMRCSKNNDASRTLSARSEDASNNCLGKPWSFYIEPTGSFGHVKTQKYTNGNSFQTAGARTGFDYMSPAAAVPDNGLCYGLGAVAEYNHWWGQVYHSAGTFASNVAYGSVYGTVAPGRMPELSFNLIAGGGYSWYTFDRYPLGSSSTVATATPGGALADAMFDIEYVLGKESFAGMPKNFRVIPSAAVQYTYTKINSYNESGAGYYNLHMGKQTVNTLSSLLGMRLNYLLNSGGAVTVRPEISAQWQYQYLNSDINTSAGPVSAAGSFGIPITVPSFARNSLVAGADLSIGMYDKYMVQLNYDLWYNKEGIINFFLLEFKTEF